MADSSNAPKHSADYVGSAQGGVSDYDELSVPSLDSIPSPVDPPAQEVSYAAAEQPVAAPASAPATDTRRVRRQVETPGVLRVDGPSSGAVMPSNRVSRRTAEATRRAAKQVGRYDSRVREHHSIPIVAFVLVALLIFGGAAFFSRRLFVPEDSGTTIQPGLEVNITIPEGAGGSEIAQILLDNGVITDSAEFFREVKSQEAEMTLKSGSYSFITGANTREVVKQLVSGPNSTLDVVTIPEGYTVRQIADVYADKLGIDAEEFMARATASNYRNDYPFLSNAANDSLEGFLFPKTYDFGGKDKSIDAIIRTMLSQYQAEMAQFDFDACIAKVNEMYGVELDEYQIVTLASIIEKEATDDEGERANVASVFYNRLASWMPLQSDATVGYVLDHDVTAEDLELDSEYNTYLNYGLTPTPICNPGYESLKAALEPADTDYYYFYLYEGDYSLHVFSETYEEHLEAISKAESAANGE